MLLFVGACNCLIVKPAMIKFLFLGGFKQKKKKENKKQNEKTCTVGGTTLNLGDEMQDVSIML